MILFHPCRLLPTHLALALSIGAVLLPALPAAAQIIEDCAPLDVNGITYRFEEYSGAAISEPICFSAGVRCGEPMEDGGPSYVVSNTGCDPALGACSIQVRVPVQLPGNQENLAASGGFPVYSARWFPASQPPDCFATDCPTSG